MGSSQRHPSRNLIGPRGSLPTCPLRGRISFFVRFVSGYDLGPWVMGHGLGISPCSYLLRNSKATINEFRVELGG